MQVNKNVKASKTKKKIIKDSRIHAAAYHEIIHVPTPRKTQKLLETVETYNLDESVSCYRNELGLARGSFWLR